MDRCQQIERSIIKKYRKPIWNQFIGGLKDYQMIQAGDKIAQLVIQPCALPKLEVVEELEETARGDNGFGSTGR